MGLSLRSYAQQAERISWRPQTAGVSGLDVNLNKRPQDLKHHVYYLPQIECSFLNDGQTTHSDLLAQADLRQHLLDALPAAHLPDGGLHRLVGDWPVPRLKLIPNGA